MSRQDGGSPYEEAAPCGRDCASIMGSRRPGGSVLKRRERLPDAPLRTGPSLVAISVDRVNFHKKPNRLALVSQLLV